jgi:hypothetical protein
MADTLKLVDGDEVEVQNRDGVLWGLDRSSGQWKRLYARRAGTTTVSVPEGDAKTLPAWQATAGARPAGKAIGTTLVDASGDGRIVGGRYEFSLIAPADPMAQGWKWEEPQPHLYASDENPAPRSGWYREVDQAPLYDPDAGHYGGGLTRQYGDPYDGWGFAQIAQ